uniref:Putative secreted protein n=1 Tax=Amblyomma triste TaxID=251400 RepID=A0A023G3D9_AMBTT
MLTFKLPCILLLLGLLCLPEQAASSAKEQCPQNPGTHVNYTCVGQVCPMDRLCPSPCTCRGWNFYACYGHCALPVGPKG